jgi:hypothetical protein
MSDNETYSDEPFERDQARQRHKRQRAKVYWLEIYLPLLAGFLVMGGLVYLIWQVGYGSASVWADLSLVFLLPLAMLCGLIPLVLLAALAAALVYLTPKIPEPMQAVREFMDQLNGRIKTWSYRIERPFIRGRQFRRSARRMFTRPDAPTDEVER